MLHAVVGLKSVRDVLVTLQADVVSVHVDCSQPSVDLQGFG